MIGFGIFLQVIGLITIATVVALALSPFVFYVLEVLVHTLALVLGAITKHTMLVGYPKLAEIGTRMMMRYHITEAGVVLEPMLKRPNPKSQKPLNRLGKVMVFYKNFYKKEPQYIT